MLTEEEVKSIKKQMIDLNVTQEQLAEKMMIGRSTLTGVLTRKHPMTPYVAKLLKEAGVVI